MNEKHINNNFEGFDEVIDIKELFFALWERKILITTITTFFAIVSVIYALSIPNIYSSKAILAPASESSSLSSKLGGLSAFAGMAGVNLSSDSSDPSVEAIERITSFDFFSSHILPNIKLENLMSVKSWSLSSNILSYDEEIFDASTKKWTRKVKPPKSIIPSEQEAYRSFKKIISVTVNKKNNYINISINHKSPYVAKRWLDLVILNINESMRAEKKKIVESSIDFLNEISVTTNINTIKGGIVKLLESQIQSLMMISSSKDYVFKIIDSPQVPELKSSPNRPIICMTITFLGGILSLILALTLHFINRHSIQSK
tara:strand:+ start:152 stop:1099 length:948 start_codon:yes stop_codon:yes gene_type:complete